MKELGIPIFFTTERIDLMRKIQCEAWGKCNMEEYLTHYKCSKCGKSITKK